jgi:hypothetical protein
MDRIRRSDINLAFCFVAYDRHPTQSNPKPDRPTPHKSNTIETLKTTIATPNYKMLNLRDRPAPPLW